MYTFRVLPHAASPPTVEWSCREGYGEERYEQVALQKKVGGEFNELKDTRFHFIDGARDIATVHGEIQAIAADVVQRCKSMPLDLLWS